MLRSFSRRVNRDDRGNIAVISALAAPLIAGAAGLSVETTYWYYKGLQLQGAADSAAFAAGVEKRAGSDDAAVIASATRVAAENGYEPAIGSIIVNLPPASGQFTDSDDAVEVLITSPAERFFSKVFDDSQIILNARAVARHTQAQDACVLSLNQTAPKAADFAGSSDAQFDGCTVMANSSAPDAINVQGAAKLTANCLIAVGGAQTTMGVTLTDCKAPLVEAPPVGDPFANVAAPSVPTGGCKSAPNNPKNSYALAPGRYCGGLDIKGNGTLAAGIYYLQGDFNIASNATLSGSGVTLYLEGDSKVTMNGTATVDLQAPTSGPYAGVLIFSDRSPTVPVTSKFNGTAASKLTGAIYMPKQAVEYTGNFSGINGCTQIVADTVKWSGNTSISVDCESLGLRSIPAYSIVKLFE